MRLVLPALVVVALAGCGGGDGAVTTGLATPGVGGVPTTSAPAGPSTTTAPDAVPGPSATTDRQATVPGTHRPIACPSSERGTAGVFDARELEGRTLADAQAAAKRHGCTVRVARRDGEDLVLTQDLSTSRINVEVTDGRVTRVLSVA